LLEEESASEEDEASELLLCSMLELEFSDELLNSPEEDETSELLLWTEELLASLEEESASEEDEVSELLLCSILELDSSPPPLSFLSEEQENTDTETSERLIAKNIELTFFIFTSQDKFACHILVYMKYTFSHKWVTFSACLSEADQDKLPIMQNLVDAIESEFEGG
jgi:hypothetical protein